MVRKLFLLVLALVLVLPLALPAAAPVAAQEGDFLEVLLSAGLEIRLQPLRYGTVLRRRGPVLLDRLRFDCQRLIRLGSRCQSRQSKAKKYDFPCGFHPF